MKRFHPSSRPDALFHKANSVVQDLKYAPSGSGGFKVQVAACLGMDLDTRLALKRMLALAQSGRVGVVGKFMPDAGVSELLAASGVEEEISEQDFGRLRTVVIPLSGISPKIRREWEGRGVSIEDLTAAKVRRAQVALGLLKMEGAEGLVIGRHDDPETVAIVGACPGAKVIEDTTDTARLAFAPSFGVVCQTTLSPGRVSWLVQQLRFRYRDARVTFLDTCNPMMARRGEELEKLLATCDHTVVVGDPGEASCEALVETSSRRGVPAVVVQGPAQLEGSRLPRGSRIALTAGGFTTDEAVRAVAMDLVKS
jgi:4-hydroxy-3-methylbut-2-enyl diphosphate reductase IspH